MLVVVSSDGEDAASVLTTLTGWSRAGLLHPFVWWQQATEALSDARVVALVEEGTASLMPPSAALAAASPTELGVCVLVMGELATQGQFLGAARTAVDHLSSLIPSDVIDQLLMLHVPVSRPHDLQATLVPAEWRKVVLMPIHTPEPGSGVDRLPDNPNLIPAHAAHGLAVLMALFRDGTGEPWRLDAFSEDVDPYRLSSVLGMQAFSRVVDGSELFGQLSTALSDVELTRRLPHLRTLHVTDAVAAAFADQLMAAHPGVLSRSPTPEPPVAPPPVKGLVPYLALVLRAMADFLMHLPVAIARRVARRLYERVRSSTESIGFSLTGKRLEPWDDQLPATGDAEVATTVPVTDLDGPVGAFWRDTVHAVIAVVDGDSGFESFSSVVIEPGAVADPNGPSVFGALRMHLDNEIAEATKTATSWQPATPPGTIDEEPPKSLGWFRRLLERLRRLALVLAKIGRFLAVLIGSIGLGIGMALGGAALGGGLGFVLIVLAPVFAVAALLWRIWALLRRVLTADLDSALRDATARHDAECARLAVLDIRRLQRRAAELADWEQIVVGVVTYPDHSELVPAQISIAPLPLDLPPACSVRKMTLSSDDLIALRGVIWNAVLAGSWRRTLLDEFVDRERDLLQRRDGVLEPTSSPLYDPFEDTSSDTYRPRRVLRSALDNGRLRMCRSTLFRESVLRAVNECLTSHRDLVTATVASTPAVDDPNPPTIDEFLSTPRTREFQLYLERDHGSLTFTISTQSTEVWPSLATAPRRFVNASRYLASSPLKPGRV